MGEHADGKEVGKWELGTRNERGDHLVEFCWQDELIITNIFFKNHKRRRYTYEIPGDIIRWQLNYFLVKNKYKNQIKSSKYYSGADIDSAYAYV